VTRVTMLGERRFMRRGSDDAYMKAVSRPCEMPHLERARLAKL